MARVNAEMSELLDNLALESKDFLVLSDIELSARVARSRLVVEQAGRAKTPIHWLNQKLESRSDLNRAPKPELLPESWKKLVAKLNFTESMVYASSGVECDTWVGPDGFVELETGGGGLVFLNVIFEDLQSIRLMPRDRVTEGMAENDPESITLWQSEDAESDYRRLLEASASYGLGAGTRPLYRYGDLALAHAIEVFRMLHAMPTAKAKKQLFQKPWVALLRATGLGNPPPQTEFWPVTLRDDGIHVTCDCGKENRIPHERLSSVANCGNCGQTLKTLSYPVVVESTLGFEQIVASASIPIVVDFWATWCTPCLLSIPELRSASAESEGKFLILWTNSDDCQELSDRFNIKAIPTAIRFMNGIETQRHAGVMKTSEIRRFAIGC